MREKNWNEYHTCLWCGNKIEQRYDDCYTYYECECAEAKRDREITEEIERLERSRPKHKYKVITKDYVVNV